MRATSLGCGRTATPTPPVAQPLTSHTAPLPPLSRHAPHSRPPPTRALLCPAHHDKMNYHPESNEVTIDAEGLVYVQQRNRLQAS